MCVCFLFLQTKLGMAFLHTAVLHEGLASKSCKPTYSTIKTHKAQLRASRFILQLAGKQTGNALLNRFPKPQKNDTAWFHVRVPTVLELTCQTRRFQKYQ